MNTAAVGEVTAFFVVILLHFGGGILCKSSLGSLTRFKRNEIGGCDVADDVDACGLLSNDVGIYVEKRRFGCCRKLAGRGRASSSLTLDKSFGGSITNRSLTRKRKMKMNI